MYLKDIQKRLIPIYNLTRKGVPFEWTDEHQNIFEGLKKDIANPPVLVMPNNKGHFTLVSDTSELPVKQLHIKNKKVDRDWLDIIQRSCLQQQLDTVLVNLNYVD